MRKRKGNGHARSPLYGAYVFRTKDPSINLFRTVVEDHFGHRVKNSDLAHIRESGGPTVGCMREWFFGKTLRPTNAAMEAAGRSIGWHRVWRKMPKE